jgi:hypothetical protein
MTDGEFLTRRQLRDAELGTKVESSSESNAPKFFELKPVPVEFAAVVVPQIIDGELLNPGADQKTEEPEQSVAEFFGLEQIEEEQETEPESLFDVSPNLVTDVSTSTIILENVASVDDLGAINENGEWLKTGSIELPPISTATGEIATVLDATETDEAIQADSISGYVSTIAPLRASGVVNTAGKIGIMPAKLAKGQNQVYLVVALSVIMVTVGGLVLAAFMLGFFK